MVFTVPPTKSELGKARGTSYHSIRRLTLAGVAPTVQYPDGEHVDTEWANHYLREGLSDAELRQYREFWANQRTESACASEAEGPLSATTAPEF